MMKKSRLNLRSFQHQQDNVRTWGHQGLVVMCCHLENQKSKEHFIFQEYSKFPWDHSQHTPPLLIPSPTCLFSLRSSNAC